MHWLVLVFGSVGSVAVMYCGIGARWSGVLRYRCLVVLPVWQWCIAVSVFGGVGSVVVVYCSVGVWWRWQRGSGVL